MCSQLAIHKQIKSYVKNIKYVVINNTLTYLMRSVTAPATTGEATLVPDNDRHPNL